MKAWIAKIRITDEGFNEEAEAGKEYIPPEEIKESILGHDFELYGIEVTDILSFEEEKE